MPFAVFFIGGIAIHATTPSHFSMLGKRDSGGCARLHPDNAKILFGLVEQYNKGVVPSFHWNGQLVFDKKGKLTMQNNWNTLVIVEEVVN